jgi:hypothetical protein
MNRETYPVAAAALAMLALLRDRPEWLREREYPSEYLRPLLRPLEFSSFSILLL